MSVSEVEEEKVSLAPPTYLLPLNFHFTSVLGPGLLHMHGFLGSQILGGPISEQREWLRTITSRLRASFSCSQRKTRKTMEKDTREAIRSVVGSGSPHRVREKFDFPAGSVSGVGAGPVA